MSSVLGRDFTCNFARSQNSQPALTKLGSRVRGERASATCKHMQRRREYLSLWQIQPETNTLLYLAAWTVHFPSYTFPPSGDLYSSSLLTTIAKGSPLNSIITYLGPPFKGITAPRSCSSSAHGSLPPTGSLTGPAGWSFALSATARVRR